MDHSSCTVVLVNANPTATFFVQQQENDPSLVSHPSLPVLFDGVYMYMDYLYKAGHVKGK